MAPSSSLPFGSGTFVFLLLFGLIPVPEKLSSRVSVLAWVCKCFQCLGIPQVHKELFSRVFTSSKEPLLVSDLDVLDYVREVRDPLPLSHLDALDRRRPLSSNLRWKFLLNLKISEILMLFPLAGARSTSFASFSKPLCSDSVSTQWWYGKWSEAW